MLPESDVNVGNKKRLQIFRRNHLILFVVWGWGLVNGIVLVDQLIGRFYLGE
jgi:hypothetical protein